MDGMGCLVPVGHKDKGGILEQQALRVPVGHKDKREILEALKVPLAHKDEGGGWSNRPSGSPWPKKWWRGLHKVGEN